MAKHYLEKAQRLQRVAERHAEFKNEEKTDL